MQTRDASGRQLKRLAKLQGALVARIARLARLAKAERLIPVSRWWEVVDRQLPHQGHLSLDCAYNACWGRGTMVCGHVLYRYLKDQRPAPRECSSTAVWSQRGKASPPGLYLVHTIPSAALLFILDSAAVAVWCPMNKQRKL